MDITELSVYSALTLEARKKLIELLLQQDKEIQEIFEKVVADLAKEIRRLEATGQAGRIPEVIDNKLMNSAQLLEEELNKLFDNGIKISVEAGMHQSKQATLQILDKSKIDWKPIERVYFRKHTMAVEHMQSRVLKGLTLSDRIWGQSRVARLSMGAIVQEGLATGDHPYKIADMLQDYVRNGAQTVVSQYPNMVNRLEGNIPMNMTYESLRLARTEMATAFGEGVKNSAELNPSNQGIRWSLSNAGVACSVCEDHANHDSGLGKGVYRLHELPQYPAHPNCLCTLSEVVEEMDDFVDRLIEWNANPLAHQDIEKWYQTVYQTGKL